jgi:nucleoside-diphosphate-sugar epimerase
MNEAPGRLVPSLIDTFGKNQKFIVLNRGHIRDFVFVEDVVQILGKLVILRETGVVNVGSGIGRTIEDMSELVMSAMGKKDLIEYGESSVEKDKVVSDTLKLNSIIGRYSWTPIEEAILRSINARIK